MNTNTNPPTAFQADHPYATTAAERRKAVMDELAKLVAIGYPEQLIIKAQDGRELEVTEIDEDAEGRARLWTRVVADFDAGDR